MHNALKLIWILQLLGEINPTQALTWPLFGAMSCRGRTARSAMESRHAVLRRVLGGVVVATGSPTWRGSFPVQPAWGEETHAEELVRLIGEARRQLDPVDDMITGCKWDAIRNVIKTAPLANLKGVILELSRQPSLEEDAGAILGMREDFLGHLQFLDTFAYNNVFIGEDRQILGTKVDFDVPRSGEGKGSFLVLTLCWSKRKSSQGEKDFYPRFQVNLILGGGYIP
ncbi:unnamed protein product [Discosporangium mesarthrocarpum]